MSTYSGRKVPHQVQSTMDRHIDFGCTVALSGTGAGTALSATLVYSTDMHVTVSGTAPGLLTVTIPPSYVFPRMVAWTADLHQTVLDPSRDFKAVKGPYTYPYGSMVASGSAAILPVNPTVGGGGTFTIQLTSGSAPPVAANPSAANSAFNTAPVTIDIKATFKNRGRDGV